MLLWYWQEWENTDGKKKSNLLDTIYNTRKRKKTSRWNPQSDRRNEFEGRGTGVITVIDTRNGDA
jgi:hypothetical protein